MLQILKVQKNVTVMIFIQKKNVTFNSTGYNTVFKKFALNSNCHCAISRAPSQILITLTSSYIGSCRVGFLHSLLLWWCF